MAFSSRLKAPGPDNSGTKDSFDSFTRKQEELADARRRAAEDEARREEYEREKVRQATIARSKEEAARRAARSMGMDTNPAAGRGGYAGNGQPDRSSTFSWKKGGSDQKPEQKGLSFGGSLKPQPTRQSGPGQPDHDTCEQAISAMVSRSYNGMKEALQLLGLPDYPLSFQPGRELKLCGHHLREEINEMIHHWMTDEKDDFYTALRKIKDIVAKPILTEEELDLLDSKDDWQKTLGPDGDVTFTRRQDGPPPAPEDDDDDEVIDVTPDGTRLSSSTKPSGSAARSGGAGKMLGEQDYYALLGVSPKATLQEIRTRFRALVLTAHPEKGGDPETFHKLNKAYSVLSDPAKRQEYDAER